MASTVLTDALLKTVQPTDKLAELWDAKVSGLCLRITPRGVKTWCFRYRPADSISFKRLRLGHYPETGLAKARSLAEQHRVGVGAGGDPQGERREKKEADRKALTFGELADRYVEKYAKAHKTSWQNDQLYLRAHVLPKWRNRKAAKITRGDAAELLDEIATTAPTSANRTQSILSKLFNWAIESEIVPANPVAGMKKRAKETAKERTLSPDEIRILWQAIAAGKVSTDIAAALRLLLLTGQRPGEIAGLQIGELADVKDNSKARAEIPAARMKAKKPTIVPLAPMALGIVRSQLASVTEKQQHVFPSRFDDRGPIARHSLSQGLARIIEGLKATDESDAPHIDRLKADPPTPHDFRRTLATGLGALGIPYEDRRAVLAHLPGDVHGVHYDKYDRLAEKRRALEAWEGHLAIIINRGTE
jgi:integrase